MKGRAIEYSQAELAFLKERSTVPRAELTVLFNNHFDRSVSVQNINAKCKRMGLKTGRTGYFTKGHKSWNKGTKGLTSANKTSFKKGGCPWNHKPVGSERINVDGYIEIKTAEPNTFELKQRVIWEKENGEIPQGHNVIFIDGDKQNVTIENLELVSNAELLIINKLGHKNAPDEVKESIRLIAKLEKRNAETARH